MKRLVILLIPLFLSCSESSDTRTETKGGVRIQFIERGSGERLKPGNVLLMHMVHVTSSGQLLGKSNPESPIAFLYDSLAATDGGLLQEVMSYLSVGDSVQFFIPAWNLWEVSYKMSLPDSIAQNEIVKFDLRIEEQLSEDGYYAYLRTQEYERFKAEFDQETAFLASFLSEKHQVTQVTKSGLRYAIHKKGEGNKPEPGDVVSVQYTGRTLTGKVFDSGIYNFELGKGEVIAGWDEGIGLLRKGAKATLYIPSLLGYGARGSGEDIPPFSSLHFEVELLDVKQ